MPTFNDARVRKANAAEVNNSGGYVLYWMQMFRRLDRNHALDYAVNAAKHLNKPLVIYEGLKLNYPLASARFHQFILERNHTPNMNTHRLNFLLGFCPDVNKNVL